MPKYMFEVALHASRAPRGSKGGRHGSSRGDAKAIEGVGGKLESFYFAFGGVDVFVIVDLPDNVTAAAAALAASETGAVTTKTIVLLTPEEMDEAAKKTVAYRAPGH